MRYFIGTLEEVSLVNQRISDEVFGGQVYSILSSLEDGRFFISIWLDVIHVLTKEEEESLVDTLPSNIVQEEIQ